MYHQAALVGKERGEGERNDSAVQFRHGDGLREHAARHAPLVFQIGLVFFVDFDRADQRDIQLLQ